MSLIAKYDVTMSGLVLASAAFDFTAKPNARAKEMWVQATGGDVRWTAYTQSQIAAGTTDTEPVSTNGSETGLLLADGDIISIKGVDMKTARFRKDVDGDTVRLHLELRGDD